MNEYSYQGFYQNYETIVNFRSMSIDELNDFRLRHGLAIGVTELIFCQNHYKKERRDPSVQEIYTLSEFISISEKKPSSIMLAGIKATDTSVGAAFDDLLKKLGQQKKKSPYSFLDIATAADSYLRKAGKKTATQGIYGKCAELGTLEFSVKGCSTVASLAFPERNSSCTLGIPAFKPYSHAEATENDVFVALAPFSNDGRSFSDVINYLLSMPGSVEAIKCASTLEDGALPFLLEKSNGFYADLLNFPGYETNPSPTVLTRFQDNAVIALVDGKAIMQFSANAQSLGLRFCAFGRPTQKPAITVRYGAGAPASFNADFLRALRFTASLYATAAESEERCEKTNTFTVNGTPCATETAYLSGHVIYSASTTAEAGFKDTANTVISAISPLVAAGADFEEISASFDVKLPLLTFTEPDVERALALLMGQYRVQAELCLLSEGSRYLCSRGELSLSCYTRARLPQRSVPSGVTKNEGDLYIFAPHTAEDGLVCFDELRKLYKLIVDLIRNGQATAVRAVTREGVQKALSDMTDSADLSEFSLPEDLEKDPIGAFIVESEENLAGLKIHYNKNSANED